MRCFVCLKSMKAEDCYKTCLLDRKVYLCSFNCYTTYCNIYAVCKLEVRIDEMGERLKSYKEKGGTK